MLKIESATLVLKNELTHRLLQGAHLACGARSDCVLRRELSRRGLVVRTLAIGKIARVTELALVITDDPVNRFTMGAAAGLFLFRIRHEVCSHILLLEAPEYPQDFLGTG